MERASTAPPWHRLQVVGDDLAFLDRQSLVVIAGKQSWVLDKWMKLQPNSHTIRVQPSTPRLPLHGTNHLESFHQQSAADYVA